MPSLHFQKQVGDFIRIVTVIKVIRYSLVKYWCRSIHAGKDTAMKISTIGQFRSATGLSYSGNDVPLLFQFLEHRFEPLHGVAECGDVFCVDVLRIL